MIIKHAKLASVITGLLSSFAAVGATTYSENFSGSTSSLSWLALNDACLTAGSANSSPGVIPGCANIGVTAPQDLANFGALRLTPAQTNQTGAILSNFTFPLSQGMQVTFTTYTYGGDSQSPAHNGADGISFMLTDGSKDAPTVAGGLGGSLGYSCSNINDTYQGMADAYLGVGIDEYGNFLNNGDNTNTGIAAVNPWGNGNYQPQRIGLRGAGNTTWAALQALNPSYYNDAAPNKSKVTAACSSGNYVTTATDASGNVTNGSAPLNYNYNAIADGVTVLPYTTSGGTLIANEGTSLRSGNPSTPTDYTKNAWPITYKLTLSPAGLLNFSYSYNNGAFQPVLVNNQITDSNGPLPSSFRFGFSSGTGGSYNVHEITCFQASPLQSNSSASANTVQSGQVQVGTQVFLASYSADNWWGSLIAAPVVVNPDQTLSISSRANWDAKCVLSGVSCTSMASTTAGVTTTPTITVQGASDRVLLTASETTGAGTAFTWGQLSTDQQTALKTNSTTNLVESDAIGQTRLNWLRGTRSDEQLQSSPGDLRGRTFVMGDIIDSSPTWVGAPTAGSQPDAFNDGIYGSSGAPENATDAQIYSQFASTNATRQNVVYVGANDGFLHGFQAGSYDASGTFISTTNKGKEVIGFMPAGLLLSHASDLTNPLYAHDYFVDATPGFGDLFYGNAWHTWLVGGVGSGGAEIYALDITKPANFTQANAASVVVGDWSTAALSHLGKTVGTPTISRMHNGQWAIIFGNGVGSGTSAGVYIGLVNTTSGAVTYQFIDTGVGTATSANGIAYVSSADLDEDHIADYLYAGDQQGNVWRIDVTSNSSADWAVSKLGNAAATPIFAAKDASSVVQPITTAISVASVKTGTVNRVMLLFGTGQATPKTSTSGVDYATGQQTFYGIWDWDMTAWNGLSTERYAALTGTRTIARTAAALLHQSVVATTVGTTGSNVFGYRTLSTSKVVCWNGSATCASGNTQYGWLFDLPASGEQIIYSPMIDGGAVVVRTAIPPVISAQQCNPGLQTGWSMAFDPASGGGLKQGFFPDANGSFAPASDGSTVSGAQLNAVGTPSTISYGGNIYTVYQTTKATSGIQKINPQGENDPSRVAWKEIKN
ncbi:MAG: PilC/PilY family type IV pilus protein [Rhodanobacter sp.]